MGSTVSFYCGPSDNLSLQSFAESIGLHLVPPTADSKVLPDSAKAPFCYLSLLPKSELHPYGRPPLRFTDAIDPMLGYMRGYFSEPYLVLGHIAWSDDVPSLAKQTKPHFRKMCTWIKKYWAPHGDVYISPEATELIAKGAHMVSVIPGQATSKFIVPS